MSEEKINLEESTSQSEPLSPEELAEVTGGAASEQKKKVAYSEEEYK